MTKELLDQAYYLFQILDKRSWDSAITKDQQQYQRYIKLSKKAWDRYERRFKKYTKSC